MTSSPPNIPASGPVWAVVVAGGSGSRFGAMKQYEPLGGRRVLDWSLDAARAGCQGVVLVVPSELVGKPEPLADVVVAGGATRSASVRAGLAAVPPDAATVLVHDAARPLASAALFEAVVAALAAGADAAVPAVAVTDTLRRIDGVPVDRSDLVAVQTPQGFRADALRAAHASEPEATDDASLVEAAGGCVVVVPGEVRNRKITDPDDLVVAEALLAAGDA
jgi:2-C-methyl-D-erythritol 4-phosphate cytidylyltransferase